VFEAEGFDEQALQEAAQPKSRLDHHDKRRQDPMLTTDPAAPNSMVRIATLHDSTRLTPRQHGPMKIYWYWPHPHRGPSPLALAVLRPGDTLTVEALPSLHGEQFGEVTEYEVIRDLPDPSDLGGRWARALRPVRLTLNRSRARARALRRGFDLAHIQMLMIYSDWLDLARLGRRTPLVSVVHDVHPHDTRLPSVERLLLKRLYRVAGHLVVFHETLRQELCEDFAVDSARVHVLPIPISATDERDVGVEKPDRPMILFFGTFRRNKGIDVFLEAVRTAGSEIEADFVIAGAGDADLERMVRDHAARLSNVTAEVGFVDQRRKRELFSQTSCVVLPYTAYHSQSGVLQDAYSYRVPLVVTDVGALGPTVREDDTGVVVPARDPSALVEAMHRITAAAGGDQRQRMDQAVLRHDYSIVGPKLRDVYDVATLDRH
jgi:glycosyltransferase involved in cell wall biosynthesis